ncbi:MAG: hypothetical protein QM751_09970 [Paludibacteraceae bacterium]
MMNTLAFVSADFFVDVDMPVLPLLAKRWEVTWYLYTFDAARYDVDFLTDFANRNGFNIKIIRLFGRRRSFKNIKTTYHLFSELREKSFSLYYFEYLGDPYSFLMSLIINRKKKY